MKLFKKLRIKMAEWEKSQDDVGAAMGVPHSSVSLRLNGFIQWKLDEVYTVCDLLEIPYNEISMYFPKDGK